MFGLMFRVGRCPECGERMYRFWGRWEKVLLMVEEGLFYTGVGMLILGTIAVKYAGAGVFATAVVMYLWMVINAKASWKCDTCGFVGAPHA